MGDTLFGYAGKILVLDLTTESSEIIDSAPYLEEWIGGHGLASKLFWDYCTDKTVEAFDPKNVIVIASNVFAGTLAPAGAGRIEMTGIGSYSNPEWYSRSSMGGRVGGMMKAAGFDAVVVQGKAEKPVWVSVVNGAAEIKSAESLWGKDTWETQTAIWDDITHNTPTGDWFELTKSRDGGRSANRPAVMAIGPAGENLARIGTVQHDAAHASGQSGFGGVWGSKNLKAIGFLGTNSVAIADPGALMSIRLEVQEKLGYNVDNPKYQAPEKGIGYYNTFVHNPYGNDPNVASRPDGCQGCFRNCRNTYADHEGNSGMLCTAGYYYTASGKDLDRRKTTSLLNQLGINGYEADMPTYLYNLYKMGVMGKGKEIDTDLPFEQYNKFDFIDTLLHRMANREEIGDDLAEGLSRAAERWGRWEEDSASILKRPNWGYAEHYDPRLEVEWSYGSILGERDVLEHGINWPLHHAGTMPMLIGETPPWSAEELVNQIVKANGLNDPMCYNYSAEGIYADPKLKACSWLRHYSRFWSNSTGLCDWMWPNFINFANWNPDDFAGMSPDVEVAMFKAVTGRDLSYEDSLEYGRKFYMIDRAIWVLQGREREAEQFAEYVYEQVTDTPYGLPAYEDGAWHWSTCLGRKLDRDKFEDAKTRLYALEGWNEKGYPMKSELEGFGLSDVAQALDAVGKLG